jgi:hypothetical protein
MISGVSRALRLADPNPACYPPGAMSVAPRRSQAGLLAALASLVAVSCGSDTIDLLPSLEGGSVGQAGSSAGSSSGGTSAGSSGTSQGGTSGNGNVAGMLSMGGNQNGGSLTLCSGYGCGGFGTNPFGGGFGDVCNGGNGYCTPCASDEQCPPELHCSHILGNVCVQCTERRHCRPGFSCDRWRGRCGPSCQSALDCGDGRVCDTLQNTCVACLDNEECEQDGDPDTHICYQQRCVECQVNADCMHNDRHVCAALRCVQCAANEDCNAGMGVCDIGRGQCL